MLAWSRSTTRWPQRWFARKAQLLGADRLTFAHMRAPIGAGDTFAWSAAVRAVSAAFDGFAPGCGPHWCGELISGGHVDHEPREGSSSGRSAAASDPPAAPDPVVLLRHRRGSRLAGPRGRHALQFTRRQSTGWPDVRRAPGAQQRWRPRSPRLLVMDGLIDNEPDPARPAAGGQTNRHRHRRHLHEHIPDPFRNQSPPDQGRRRKRSPTIGSVNCGPNAAKMFYGPPVPCRRVGACTGPWCRT